MRKLALLGAAAAFAFAANNAKADAYVNFDVTLDKDIRVLELIAKLKVVGLVAFVVNRPDKAAESEALANQRNEYNKACENCAEKVDAIVGSGNRNSGILSVNAASGNMNNQGTVIAFAVAQNPRTLRRGFADAQAAAAQYNNNNNIDTINVPFRDARIVRSFNGNSGIVAANVAPGNINNQANVISIAASDAVQGVALSEALLGQVNAYNNVVESDTHKNVRIANSFNRNNGVVAGNVAAGNMANQSNVVAISAIGF